MRGSSLLILIITCGFVLGCEQKLETKPDLSEKGRYIVVLKKDRARLGAQRMGAKSLNAQSIRGMLHSLPGLKSLRSLRVFSRVIQGGVFHISAAEAKRLAANPDVAYVEKDHRIQLSSVQSRPPWGLDRIDQQQLPLDDSYTYPAGGAQVHAYVIDTGVLISHNDFEGRAVHGYDAVDDDEDATDCNGHGTHVAGTLGGKTYGVAKQAKIYGVRVLDCNGSGSYSDVIAGIEWVTENHIQPAVANMSLGGPASQALDDAVEASMQAGVTYVVAAGNSNTSACRSSPSRVADAYTVGSTTQRDGRSSFSNYGNCVDVFAPGSDIESTWYTSDSATRTISGTSMASPHVAGVAALYLAQHPQSTPAQVMAALTTGSLTGKISNVGSGSPNRLIQTAFLGEGDDGDDGDDDDGDQDDGGDDDDGDDDGPGLDAPCFDCAEHRGTLTRGGERHIYPERGYYLSTSGFHRLWLQGPVEADFDLYLYRWQRGRWIQVARSISSDSEEEIQYRGSSGYYRILVRSYEGTGAYRLWVQTPE